MTQKTSNPFLYTDSNKRYHTYDYYLRRTYGGKCAKIPLDAGLTCPNIDGRCGRGGCIYCSARGGGDFASSAALSLTEQYRAQTEILRQKWKTDRFIPYLQAHTNTYAPVRQLCEIYQEILAMPGAVALHIATRADCLGEDVVALLGEISTKIDLTVELGLQTSCDQTALAINRGHTFADFQTGYFRLRDDLPQIRIAFHIINGLPGENREDMLATARDVAALHPNELKIHSLHVLKGTVLADLYQKGKYVPISKQDYIDITVSQLEVLPSDMVISRLTGDGAKEDLLAPSWSRDKRSVLNQIDQTLMERQTFQGKLCKMHNI